MTRLLPWWIAAGLSTALIAVFFAVGSDQSWECVSRTSQDITPGIRLIVARIRSTSTASDTYARVLIFKPDSYRAWIEDQPTPTPNRLRLRQACERSGAIAGINGGYFDSGFQPVGLFVLNQTPRSAPSDSKTLSAVIGIDRAGKVHIRRRSERANDDSFALQAGPFMIDPGGRIGIAEGDLRQARRSVLATSAGGDLLVVHCSEQTLRKTAEILHDATRLFGIGAVDRAVNLDGGPSAAFYVKLPDGVLTENEVGPVRNFLLFSRKD